MTGFITWRTLAKAATWVLSGSGWDCAVASPCNVISGTANVQFSWPLHFWVCHWPSLSVYFHSRCLNKWFWWFCLMKYKSSSDIREWGNPVDLPVVFRNISSRAKKCLNVRLLIYASEGFFSVHFMWQDHIFRHHVRKYNYCSAYLFPPNAQFEMTSDKSFAMCLSLAEYK